MTTVQEQRQFLQAFYEIANQKAPNDLVDVHVVGKRCELDGDASEELARLLLDAGLLDNEGTFPAYRLTPKGRHEVREALRGSVTKHALTPRLTLHMSPLGDWPVGQKTPAEAMYPVGSQDCAAIHNVIEILQQGLRAKETLAGYAQAQWLEVVRELGAEVNQPYPNGLRLRGLLLGLASALYMAGPDEEVDHAVKVALSFLHIDVTP